MSEVTTTFGELIKSGTISVTDGYRAKNSDLGGDGLIFLRAGHVTDAHIDFANVERFHAKLTPKLQDKTSRVGDVIVTTKGNSTGRTSFVDATMPTFVYSPHLSRWRVEDKNKVDSGFLRYWSRSPQFVNQMRGLAASTDMAPYLSLRDQQRLEITLPHIDTQRAIGGVLGALDDKIEQNRRTGRALEGLARATFKAWFVDFEPVKAKAAGQTSFPGIPPAAFAALPDRLTDSPLGPVPQGWRISTVGADLKTSLGGTPSRAKPEYWTDGTVPWINSGEVNKFPIINPTSLITPAAIASSSTKLIPARSTVIAITGATLGQVSILGFASCTNQSVVSIIESKELPTEFVYLWIKENIDRLLAKSTGAAQQHVNKEDVSSLPLLCPTLPVMEEYMSIVGPMFDSVLHAAAESRKLAALRNYLLPRLLSGRVRVRPSQAEVKP